MKSEKRGIRFRGGERGVYVRKGRWGTVAEAGADARGQLG